MNEETILQSKVPPLSKGKTLLEYLSSRFRYQTIENWSSLIGQGKVQVNGKQGIPGQLLRKGDLVSYRVILKEPSVDRHIGIVHEEDTFLVAVKPGQLPSHADGNYIKNTFIYLVTEMVRAQGWEGDVRLVHRLDRETSGLMVVAKDRESHLALTRQFEQGLVEKEYLAVVKGLVKEDRFQVEGAITRDTESAISIRHKVVPSGTPNSKPSLTLFEKVQGLQEATLLKCVPKTGRTNQIRVHLDSLGHPLVGDKLYGRTDEQFLEFVKAVKNGTDPSTPGPDGISRHLLHAGKLSFKHPGTGKLVSFTAEPPPDMGSYISKKS